MFSPCFPHDYPTFTFCAGALHPWPQPGAAAAGVESCGLLSRLCGRLAQNNHRWTVGAAVDVVNDEINDLMWLNDVKAEKSHIEWLKTNYLW